MQDFAFSFNPLPYQIILEFGIQRSHVLKLKLHHFFLSRKNLMFSSKGVVGVGGTVAGKGVKLLCTEKKNLCLVP